MSEEHLCIKCTGNCLACTSATDCTTCPLNMAFVNDRCVCDEKSIGYQGRCYKNTLLDGVETQCPAGQYEYPINGVDCHACDSSCAACIGPGAMCLQCTGADGCLAENSQDWVD
jgi:hypothetical protein